MVLFVNVLTSLSLMIFLERPNQAILISNKFDILLFWQKLHM